MIQLSGRARPALILLAALFLSGCALTGRQIGGAFRSLGSGGAVVLPEEPSLAGEVPIEAEPLPLTTSSPGRPAAASEKPKTPAKAKSAKSTKTSAKPVSSRNASKSATTSRKSTAPAKKTGSAGTGASKARGSSSKTGAKKSGK